MYFEEGLVCDFSLCFFKHLLKKMFATAISVFHFVVVLIRGLLLQFQCGSSNKTRKCPIKKTTYIIIIIMQTNTKQVYKNKDNSHQWKGRAKYQTRETSRYGIGTVSRKMTTGGVKPGLLAPNLTLIWKVFLKTCIVCK